MYGVCVLPNSMFFQQPLDRDRELPQEALDDWPTLGKFILHLDLQDVSGQRDKVKPLEGQTHRGRRILRIRPLSVIGLFDICVCTTVELLLTNSV